MPAADKSLARSVLDAAHELDDKLKTLPEAELVAEFDKALEAIQGAAVKDIAKLGQALSGHVLSEYAIGIINSVNSARSVAKQRLAALTEAAEKA